MPNIKIPKRQCDTCIFKPGNEELLAIASSRWTGKNYQNCHAFRIEGDERYDEKGRDTDVWCRGFFERELSEAEKDFVKSIPGFVEKVDLIE